MLAADVLVCNSEASHHSVAVSSNHSPKTEPIAVWLHPGDCYTTSNGERIKLKIANPYRIDTNVASPHAGSGNLSKEKKAGTYTVKKYKTSRNILVVVR